MVIFYTMAYNAERTLPRTIESVLNQTEQDWIWYLLDNAAQDATGQIIHEYAAKDPRIIPIKNEKNLVFTDETSYVEIAKRQASTDWFCFLDADDEYKPEFLAEMLAFSQANQLDVAACGSDFIQSQTGTVRSQRVLEQDLILTTPDDFEKYFCFYHRFMRTNWAKLFSIKAAKQFDVARCPDVFYGGDTLCTQEMLRNADRFGILAKSLHRYYVIPKSRSYQWNPARFETDQALYRFARSFLIDKCGTVSTLNHHFLQAVYCDAIADTIAVIQGSDLSPAAMLHEYRTIALHPLTLAAYRECKTDRAVKSKATFIKIALKVGSALGKQKDDDFRAVMQALVPHCGQAVSLANAQLFLENPNLLQALLRDDPDIVMEDMLARMERHQHIKKYAVAETIQALAVDKPLLCQIGDPAFLQKYTQLYLKVWRGETLAALEEMTGQLMDDCVLSGRETFLRLYVSLAAVENQIPAFLFGNLYLAQLYLEQGRREECRALVDDLTEMGADNEELSALRQALGDTL